MGTQTRPDRTTEKRRIKRPEDGAAIQRAGETEMLNDPLKNERDRTSEKVT